MTQRAAMEGPKTSTQVIDSITLYGMLGHASESIDHSALKLLHNNTDEFALEGKGFKTRWKKFISTTKVFAKGGACAGALVSDMLTAPIDFLTGRGMKRDVDEAGSFLDKGILGHTLRYSTQGISIFSEGVGALSGLTVGALTLAAQAGSDKNVEEWLLDGASGGARAGGKMAAHLFGTVSGITLNVVRIPSILVKYIFSGTFALAGAIIGAIGGAIRAAANK